jgi:AcrR family transcriptional regulator
MAAERDEDRPSRGRPARLSRAAIVAAARSLVARDGVDGLTMRTLAAELGSSPPALYRHVGGREEVLALLLAQLAEELPRPPLPDAPRPRLLAVCALMHDWLAERPWAIEVVAADAMPGSVAWLVEEIAGALVALGLDDRAAIAGYEAIWQLTVGELVLRHAPRRPPGLPSSPSDVDAAELPLLARLAPGWPAVRAEDRYLEDVGVLVEGLLVCERVRKRR